MGGHSRLLAAACAVALLPLAAVAAKSDAATGLPATPARSLLGRALPYTPSPDGPSNPPAAVVSLSPARLLDTRAGQTTVDGLFEATGAVAAGGQVDLPVVGRGGVPSSGVGAVVVNVTVTGPLGSVAWFAGLLMVRIGASTLGGMFGFGVPRVTPVG